MSSNAILLDKTRNFVTEPEQKLPVVADVDVLVVGGGTAGVVAAVAAARTGAKTLIVERGGYVGGTGSAALMCLYNVSYETTCGICREMIDDMAARGGAVCGPVIPYDPEVFKQVASQKLRSVGAGTLFYTSTARTIVEHAAVKGIIIENKSGRQAVLAKVVVDATGDGDVAVSAGAEYMTGRETDNKMRPMTVIFKAGPVDILKIKEYWDSNPDDFSPDFSHNVMDLDNKLLRLDGFFEATRRANKEGRINEHIHYLRLHGIVGDIGNLYVNSVRVYNVAGTSGADLSRAQQEAMQQIAELMEFLRTDIPGFENAVVMETAVSMGVRESRRIVGDYTLTVEDCASSRVFDDAIMTSQTRKVAGVHVHSPDGGEGAADDPYVSHLQLPLVEYSVPYGVLLPKGLEGILVAGRCVSSTHEADGWIRGQTAVMAVAQAVGTAAALAVKGNTSLRDISIEELQKSLIEQGCRVRLP